MRNTPSIMKVWAVAALLWMTVATSAQAQTSVITRVASFEYDAAGMLIKEVIEPDSPDHCLQTTHGYNAQGNPISTSTGTCAGASGHAISSAGVARTTTKDYLAQTVTIEGVSYTTPAGVFATSTTNALNQTESYEHDPRHGRMTKLIGPNGGVTTWAYDSFGRKTRENRADGTYSVWEHKLCQAAGQALDPVCANPVSNGGLTHSLQWYSKETSYGSNGVALAAASYSIHDGLGRAVRARSDSFLSESVPANRFASIQDTVYNALGQVAYQSIAYLVQGGNPEWSHFEYDQLGRVIKETRADNTVVLQTAYNGLEIVTTNALGQVKKTYWNATGQAERVEDAQGQTVLYGYDPLGQLTQTNAAGSITKLSYDLRGRKTSMQDPAMGRWDYAYNAFGELVWQQDSLSQAVTVAYDPLGRMTGRTEPDLVSHWYYDKKADGSSCGAGIGKLCEATANNGYRRQHTYDAMGRPTSTSNVLDNATQPAVVTQVYDSVTGRLKEQTWPSGYKALYEYTEAGTSWSAGHLWRVRGMDGATQNALWQAKDKDPQGRLVRYQGGNGVVTQRDIEAVTGNVNGIQATLNGQTQGNVLNHSYGYDSLGNLLTRSDANTGVAESFSYDTLNRLSLFTTLGGGLENQQQVQVLYDARGNIKYKSDVGYYHYDGDRPNRLTAITTTQGNWGGAVGTVTVPNAGTKALAYAFDDYLPGVRNINLGQGDVAMGNGNLMYTVSQDQAGGAHTVRWEAYTSFNKIREMRFGNLSDPANPTDAVADRTVAFVYGPEHQRLRQTITLTSNAPSHMEAGTTWYMNGPDSLGLSYEKEVKANGLIEHKHYLSAGGAQFALHTQRDGNLNGKPAKAVSYFHHDHLGSLAAITNEAGAVVERLAYDPWGKRRQVDGPSDPNGTLTSTVTKRGYTMHEHMDEMGVINMNGRVNDQAIGRFLTTDPFIQVPYFLQSFNRYAYVWNSPLRWHDPSGFIATLGTVEVRGERPHSVYGGGGIGPYGGGNRDPENKPGGSGRRRGQAVSVVVTMPSIPEDIKKKKPPVKVKIVEEQVQVAFLSVPVNILRGLWAAKTTADAAAAAAAAAGGIGLGYAASEQLNDIARENIRAQNALSASETEDAGVSKAKDEVRDKIPAEWGDGEENRKEGTGHRWADPDNPKGTGVRVDVGDPDNSNPSQQVDHVVVRDDGVVIGRDGRPINGSIKQDPVNAHIPLSEYKNWRSWNKP